MTLGEREEIGQELDSYFTSKFKEFYKLSIYKLVDRWNQVDNEQ